MTKAEYDAEVSVIENEQHRLTSIMSVADIVPKDWAMSGFVYRDKMRALDAQLVKLKQSLLFTRFMMSERMKEKRQKRERSMDGRLNLRDKGHRELWSPVDADMAIALKQKGFVVRCIGVTQWEVRSA